MEAQRQGSTQPLTFKVEEIQPTGSAKILGVIMDSELKYQQHMMRNLRLNTTREIVISMVFPVADYASVVWSPGGLSRDD